MKCGHCHENHDSVDQVRACYRGAVSIKEPPQITDRQISYLNSLRVARGLSPYPDGTNPKQPRVKMSRQAASDEISHWTAPANRIAIPHETHPEAGPDEMDMYSKVEMEVRQRIATGRTVPGARTPEVIARDAANKLSHLRETKPSHPGCNWGIPPGRYAFPKVSDTQNDSDMDFIRVDIPDSGRYKGWVFITQIIGGKPEFSVKNPDRKRRMFEAILEYGIPQSQTLFGRTIGRCWKCGRTLTQKHTREAGIGDDCASREAA